MNALIITVMCAIFALIAIPTIAFLYNTMPELARLFKSWLNWIFYKED